MNLGLPNPPLERWEQRLSPMSQPEGQGRLPSLTFLRHCASSISGTVLLSMGNYE